jgi:GNAT superfamily N-acetyltransferase
MDIRKAGFGDVDMLTDNRLEFVCSIRNIENKEEFRCRTREYLQKHIEDGSLISYIALDGSKIVSSCILCIYQTLPIPSCLNGKGGLLLNVYTNKNYRRQGLAFNLINMLIEEARSMNVGKIHLNYTDEGYPLYKKLGFFKQDSEMVLKL